MMKEIRKNGENLSKYMNSRNQNPQPVVTMMTKLTKAWDEFQEKLLLTKETVNEGKNLPQVRLLCLCTIDNTSCCCIGYTNSSRRLLNIMSIF